MPKKIKPEPHPAFEQLKIHCKSCSLSEMCLPHGLTKDELEELDSSIKYKHKLERDEVLFHSGEKATSLYAVRSGSFKTTMVNSDGAEQVTGFFLPGELVGLDGMGGNNHCCTATALETSTICELPANDFDHLCEAITGLRKQMMRLIGQELSKDQQMLLTLGQMNAEERLATFLVGLSHRFQERGFSATEFNLSMSRHDLANYLGLAVETLSRLFSRFQDTGLLYVSRRHIEIVNYPELCRLAHAECPQEQVEKTG